MTVVTGQLHLMQEMSKVESKKATIASTVAEVPVCGKSRRFTLNTPDTYPLPLATADRSRHGYGL